jgi:hypothetical protein
VQKRIFQTAILVFFFSIAGVGTSSADTEVIGAINVDTVWNAAGSPYTITADVTVAAGFTLTIEQGVTVRFQGTDTGAELIVLGNLIVNGTSGSPVVFLHQNAAGGAWTGLRFESGSTGDLNFMRISHASTAMMLNQPTALSIAMDNVTITAFTNYGIRTSTTGTVSGALIASNLDIEGPAKGTGTGIYLVFTDLTLTDSWIRNTQYGVYAAQASDPNVMTSIFSNNNYGIYNYTASASVSTSVTTTVNHCTFWRNNSAIYNRGYGYSSSYPHYVNIDNSIFGNNTLAFENFSNSSNYLAAWYFDNNVYWGGTLSINAPTPSTNTGNLNYNALLVDPDGAASGLVRDDFAPTDRSPARSVNPADPAATMGAIPFAGALSGSGYFGYWYVNHTFAAGSTSTLTGDMIVAPGVTLTFLPGATIRAAAGSDSMNGGLNPNKVEIVVQGNLEADGTNSMPVVLTSDAVTPAPGDWYGIVIPSTAETFNVAQVNLGYATRGVSLLNNDHVTAGSTIHHCSEAGVYIDSGTPDVIDMNLRDNQVGLRIENGANVNITGTNIWNSVAEGLYSNNSTIAYDVGIVHNNGTDGIYWYTASTGRSAALTHVTVADNTAYGIQMSTASSYSYPYILYLYDSSVTHNGNLGVYQWSGGSLTCGGSNIWGNVNQPYYSFVLGSTCYSLNPLYADIDNQNFEPTKHSPNRALGRSGTYVGGLPYNGAPSPHIEGYLWDGYDFTEAESPYPVRGDIVVPIGAEVTFEAGVELDFSAKKDEMGGGADNAERALSSFTINSGANFAFEGGDETVLFTSDADTPAAGDWSGIVIYSGGGKTVTGAEIEDRSQIGGPNSSPGGRLDHLPQLLGWYLCGFCQPVIQSAVDGHPGDQDYRKRLKQRR